MKTKITQLIYVCLFISLAAFKGNQPVMEGVAEYGITFLHLTPEMQQSENMLPKKMAMYFKGENFKSEMATGMGNTITIYNQKKKEFYLLMDMMGQKTAIIQTDAEMKATQAKANIKNLKVEQLSDTKNIAGYTCKKAIISFEMEGKSETVECFYTKEIASVGNHNTSPGFDQIDGFMMEYTLNLQGVKMRMMATKITPKPIEESMFNIPAGFKVKSLKELTGEN